MDINNNYDQLLEDKIINEEEYNNLKEKYSNISPSIESLINKETTKEEINEAILNYAKDHAKKSEYKTNKLSLNRYIFELIATILYFGVLQYVLKGQTIGKKIFKLFVVNESDEVPSIYSFMIRSLFTSTIIISLANSILALTLSYKGYASIYNYITSLSSFYVVFMFAIVVLRDDTKGLHDLILKTHVKLLNEDNKEEVKTLEFKEKENEKSTNKTNRNVSKRSSK